MVSNSSGVSENFILCNLIAVVLTGAGGFLLGLIQF